MRRSVFLLSALTLAGSVACASGGASAGAGGDAAAANATPRLSGLIQPRGGSMSGEVNVSPTDRAGEFRVNLTLRGSAAGQQHPWHVHNGRCDAEGPIVGSSLSYTPLQIRGDGNIDITQTVRQQLDPNRQYYVDIHASRGDDRILACADLQPAR